jgi:predicted GNAT family acetyltransferase
MGALNMPIDPSKVAWDEAPAPKAIDVSQVKWDDAPPATQAPKVAHPLSLGEVLRTMKGALPSVQDVGNIEAGVLRGAGSVGSTLLAPYDIAKDAISGKGLSLESNRERRAGIDGGLREMGAQPDSGLYKTGKIGGEILGTAGVGGLLANGARALGAAPSIVQGLSTGGLNVAGASGLPGMLLRGATGATTGAATAGLVNPEDAGMGAAIGGALPTGAKLLAATGKAVGGGVKSAFQPLYESGRKQIVGNALRDFAGSQADDALRNLQNAGELVDGSMPTVGQASGVPSLAAVERASLATSPEATNALSARLADQNEARVAALRSIAGDKFAKEAALSARQDAAQVAYTKARDSDLMRRTLSIQEQVAKDARSIGVGLRGAPQSGVSVSQKGTYLSAENSAGNVGGHVRGGALHISHADVAEAMRGKGNGMALYRSLIDDAHSKGLKVFSDKAVEKDAVNIYEALARRGYGVSALGGKLDDGAAYGAKNGAAFEVLPADVNKMYGDSTGWLGSLGNVQAKRPATESAALAIRPTKTLEDLAKRPAFSGFINDAKKLAANKGQDIGDPLTSIDGLHYLKLAIDDALEPSATNALGRNARSALMDMKSQLTAEMDKISPIYGVSRQAYQQASRPINQMDVGEELMTAVRPLDGQIIPTQFAKKLTDETAQRATSFKGATLENTLEPAQLKLLQGVKDDLARAEFAKNAGRGVGSNTVQNLAYTNMLNESGLPGFIRSSKAGQVAGGLLGQAGKVVYSRANQELAELMAQTMLSPQEAALLMAKKAPTLLQIQAANAGRKGLLGASKAAPVLIAQ